MAGCAAVAGSATIGAYCTIGGRAGILGHLTIADHVHISATSLVTRSILKSGVVDGMAYSLYSDGSIEAQMPEGMMRFASIDELRTHLDQRP